MKKRAESTFQVTGWDPSPGDEAAAGPALGEVVVTKRYEGDLTGEGRARLLTCQADPDDRSAGAGYVASERVSGTLGDRKGSFVLQHWGVVAPGKAPWTGGHVVPGSGTDGLEGLSGQMEIAVAPDGTHTLRLDYEIE